MTDIHCAWNARILLLDDEDFIRRAVRQVLNGLGYTYLMEASECARRGQDMLIALAFDIGDCKREEDALRFTKDSSLAPPSIIDDMLDFSRIGAGRIGRRAPV